MSALPYPTYGISNLYLFPVYQTREAYREATGVEPPPYDQNRPVKSWFDPKAAASPKRKLIYENVIAFADNGVPLVGPAGEPVLEPLLIDRDEAATVNIPRKEFKENVAELPQKGIEIPVPLRALEPGEELYFQFGNTVAVKNIDLFSGLEEGFTRTDRAMLRAIATKLGVTL
jgi:hypothetical protein